VTALTWGSDFERINRHRALAELIIHNRKWLPWWLTTSVLGDFCEQAECFLRGEGLPPFPVRLWWAYRHWKFRRNQRRKLHWHPETRKAMQARLDTMQQSKITGDRFTPAAMIPLPEGQHVKFVPVMHRNGHEIEVTDTRTGKRRKVFIDDTMLGNIADPRSHEYLSDLPPEMRKAIWFSDDGDFEIDCRQVRDLKRRWINSEKRPTDLGSFPRPNCPKCHTPSPELGTPLDGRSPSGWGDSYFTCSNYNCQHTWKWKKSFPLLVENNNKQGTVTGTLIKGTDIPFHLFGQTGATIEQVNEAVRKIANVAGISAMTPQQQLKMQEIIQDSENACQKDHPALAKITNRKEAPLEKAYRRNLIRNLGFDHR
jgi:hypothetical protein